LLSLDYFSSLSAFCIGKYEVTQAQWKSVTGTDVRQQRDKTGTGWPLGKRTAHFGK
jgi:formylglycine-generating enzyme required for sulfatase activity